MPNVSHSSQPNTNEQTTGYIKYAQCPFCGSRSDGSRIFRCAACGEFFCEREGYAKSVSGWTYCPYCSNMELAEDIITGIIDTNNPDIV